jgi:uridine kinase
MKGLNDITITISGAAGTGKTTIAKVLMNALDQVDIMANYKSDDYFEFNEEAWFDRDLQRKRLASIKGKVLVQIVEQQAGRQGI